VHQYIMNNVKTFHPDPKGGISWNKYCGALHLYTP